MCSPFVKLWQTSELVLRAARPLTFMGDGEFLIRDTEFRISLAPRALNLIVHETTSTDGG